MDTGSETEHRQRYQNPSRLLTWWRRALITVTALAAAVASFVFLRDLALHAGWPAWAAALLPLSIDALAGMALTQYRLTGDKTAGTIAVLVIAGSATGNAYSHLYSTGLLEPGTVAITVVGAVPAVTVGLVVHLATKGTTSWHANRNRGTDTVNDTPEPSGAGSSAVASGSVTSETINARDAARSSPKPVTGPPPKPRSRSKSSQPRTSATKVSSQKQSDIELVSLVVANGWAWESQNWLASRLSVGKVRAAKLQRAAQQQASSRSDPEPEKTQVPEPEPEPTAEAARVPETTNA